MDSEVCRFHEEGGWMEGSEVEIFGFVPVEVACSDRSLAVQTMNFKGC